MVKKTFIIFVLFIASGGGLVYYADSIRGRFAIAGLFLDILGGWFISKRIVTTDMSHRATSIAINSDFYRKHFTWFDRFILRIYNEFYLIPEVFDNLSKTYEESRKQEIKDAIGKRDGIVGFILLFFGFAAQAVSYMF